MLKESVSYSFLVKGSRPSFLFCKIRERSSGRRPPPSPFFFSRGLKGENAWAAGPLAHLLFANATHPLLPSEAFKLGALITFSPSLPFSFIAQCPWTVPPLPLRVVAFFPSDENEFVCGGTPPSRPVLSLFSPCLFVERALLLLSFNADKTRVFPSAQSSHFPFPFPFRTVHGQ